MPKGKEKKKHGAAEFEKLPGGERPSKSCKTFLHEFIVKFYETNELPALVEMYVRYQHEAPKKFKDDMRSRMLQALQAPMWDEETNKRGFMRFLEDRLHDALWNPVLILKKYHKSHRAKDADFLDVVLRAECFLQSMRPFANNQNRSGSIQWWNSVGGSLLESSRLYNLQVIPETARIYEIEKKRLRGGYGTISKVRMAGVPGIEEYWEFAAKTSNHAVTRPDLAKVEHQNESLAVRIGHPGVIRFVAIHPNKYQGYTYWWNGGTIREMLSLDARYGDHVYEHFEIRDHPEGELERVRQLVRFRNKRTELAWALMHIMNEVHKSNNLHNDISPDNILLHFPQDESRVYIGVCDWGLTTNMDEKMRSLYTFTKPQDRLNTLQARYWVDPRVAYLYKESNDIDIIPFLDKSSEEFATARIAQQILKRTMSTAYENLQHKIGPHRWSNQDLANGFDQYLEMVVEKKYTLAHVVNRFMTTHNWPVPNEHFRTKYE